jgi:hypothetical protein
MSRNREALLIDNELDKCSGAATHNGNLAEFALERKDWPAAEAFAMESLSIAEDIGHQSLIAQDCRVLAEALVGQGRQAAGLPYAQRAVEIFTRLRTKDLAEAQAVLKECEEAATDDKRISG